MTQEIRITVDANLYYRSRPEDAFDKDHYIRFWKSELENFIFKASGADHKFINVKVDVIPHDNDRDYTEEDAEKHLNGEPEKKRKTYAEDFFEKFPNADTSGYRCLCDGKVEKVPKAYFWDIYGTDMATTCLTGNPCIEAAQSALFWMMEKPEDDHA